MSYTERIPANKYSETIHIDRQYIEIVTKSPKKTGQMFPHTKDVNIQPTGWVEPFAFRKITTTGQTFPR